MELWVVELCGKGMQLDEQEVQILSLVEMLQMIVYIVCTTLIFTIKNSSLK